MQRAWAVSKRCFGTRPLTIRERKQASRTPRRFENLGPVVYRSNFANVHKFFVAPRFTNADNTNLLHVTPRPIHTTVSKDGEMTYIFKERKDNHYPLFKFQLEDLPPPFPDEDDDEELKLQKIRLFSQSQNKPNAKDWQTAFNFEKQLLDYFDRMPILDAERIKSRVCITGDCLYFNPNGNVAVYGTKDEVNSIISSAIPGKYQVPMRFKMFPLHINSALEHADTLGNLRNHVKRKAMSFVDGGFLNEMDYAPNIPDGIYRINAALSAVNADALKDDYYLMVLVRRTSGGDWVILPGSKRKLFETAHKCAARSLVQETGITLDVPFDTPAVDMQGSAYLKNVLFMRQVPGSTLKPLPLQTSLVNAYGRRFQKWSSDTVGIQKKSGQAAPAPA
eukprot:TRINITY_DN365_c0_g1_i2.p1 TRINITY_DN365_c0_g1~~TRINITY_DN365_c0_g1_i2.p1  ORF type:complete len:392 (-),score=83.49 TRINITY_DN365_c0_g1_i2:810-1985(-)